MKAIFKNIVKIVMISSIFLSLNSYAQAPQKMSYQAVLRNAGNALVSNAPVAIRVSVLQGSATGTAVYVERHTVTTNVNGLATFEIGSGTLISGSFSGINWASGVYFVKTETDPVGGTNYTISGTSQLLSVPYALYAKAVDGVSATNTTNWNSAFSWGNHSGLYRPVTYVPDWSEVTNKPVLDGSETKVRAGTNVTVTGAGTTASPFVINSTGTSGTPSPQWSTTGNNISNTNTGNVGIGVSDPLHKLDVSGRVLSRGDGTTANLPGVVFSNMQGDQYRGLVGLQSDSLMGFYGIGNTMPNNGWGLNMNVYNGNVGINTNNAQAPLHVAEGAVLFNSYKNLPFLAPDPPMQGWGIRMMWYPGKAAFRAGYTDKEWDKDSIGLFSVATGYRTKAIAEMSTSMGEATTASGTAATSMGSKTVAKGYAATSMGFQTKAMADYSTSMGSRTEASGYASTAMGRYSKATYFDATSMGYFSSASGAASVAMGVYSRAKAWGSAVVGMYNDSTDSPQPVSADPSDRIFQVGNGTASSRSNAVTVLRNGNTGLGVTDPFYKLDVGSRMRIRSTTGNSAGLWLNNEANTASPAFIGMLADDKVGFYGAGAGWGFTMNTASGNVGVGTEAPAAKLEVNGFTKLGSDAPAIKYKKLTGTTGATEGGTVSIPHGIPLAKILSVSVLVTSQYGLIHPSYNRTGGFDYNYIVDDVNIWILNNSNSGEILSKPFTILITYEE